MLGKYKPEVFNCYSSHTQAVNVGEAGLEQMPDDRANVWRSWPVRSAIVALCALPFLLWWVSSSFSAIASTPQKAATLSTPTPSPTYAPAPRLPPPTPHPVAQGENRTAAAAVVERSDPTPPPLPTPTPLSREWRVRRGRSTQGRHKVRHRRCKFDGPSLLSQDDCEIDHLLRWSCQMEDGRATTWSGGATSPLYAGRPEGFGGY
jgi:Zonula occludens toxin